MATDALAEGFAETMWIDSDIGFEADDVEKLRGHGLPLRKEARCRKNPGILNP